MVNISPHPHTQTWGYINMNLNVTKILILGEEIYQISYLHKMEFSLNGGIALVVLFRVKSVYFLKFSHSGGYRCSKVGRLLI